MKCDCCGRRKHLFESFEDISHEDEVLHICVDCSTLVYKVRDAIKQKDDESEFDKELKKRMSKNSKSFKEWYRKKITKS